MSQVKFNCFKCKAEIVAETVGIRDECDCGEDLHCCYNCRFYDPGAYNECKESSADVVRDKDRANFCDYFSAGRGLQSDEQQKDLKAAAEALFKK